jgi:hypothetical protein
MTGRSQTLPWWLKGGMVKDDRKQNTLSPEQCLKNSVVQVKNLNKFAWLEEVKRKTIWKYLLVLVRLFSNLEKREISFICLPHNLIVLLARKQLNVNITYNSGGEEKITIRKRTVVNEKKLI